LTAIRIRSRFEDCRILIAIRIEMKKNGGICQAKEKQATRLLKCNTEDWSTMKTFTLRDLLATAHTKFQNPPYLDPVNIIS